MTVSNVACSDIYATEKLAVRKLLTWEGISQLRFGYVFLDQVPPISFPLSKISKVAF